MQTGLRKCPCLARILEVIAKDRIAVAQEVARELGKGKCLAQLLSGPICGRVGGIIFRPNSEALHVKQSLGIAFTLVCSAKQLVL